MELRLLAGSPEDFGRIPGVNCHSRSLGDVCIRDSTPSSHPLFAMPNKEYPTRFQGRFTRGGRVVIDRIPVNGRVVLFDL